MKTKIQKLFLAAACTALLTMPAAAQPFTTLYSFTGSDGANPYAGLTLSGSTLYGTASGGGSSYNGTVFAVNTGGTGFTNLHSFTALFGTNGIFQSGTNSDGANPNAGLILSGNILYGTADDGGTNGAGTVFAINTNGTGYTVLHTFSAVAANLPGFNTNSDGAGPNGLILSGNTLYGTTFTGGTNGAGTVFAINTNGTGFTVLHTFTAISAPYAGTNSDGTTPYAGLILSGNTLYGTASGGGIFGYGTIFKINTNGAGFTNLYNFAGGNDGANPASGLILSGNTLYSTAAGGGTNNDGTVFAINTNGTGFMVVHTFTGGNDGADPDAGLILSSNTLYGMATYGGSAYAGTVFAVNTNGTGFTVLHSFTGSDGSSPYAGLILSGNALYGTTAYGGSSYGGTVFSIWLGPTIQFTASPTNYSPPLTVQFNSPGVDGNGSNIVSWNWNFGDGATSTLQNPSHIYTTLGTFSPGLVVTNNNGVKVVGIGPSITVAYPTVQFTASPYYGFTPLTVQFNTTNIDSQGNAITGWNWDFGDGSTSTLQNPSHIYSYSTTNYGVFSPTLVATNNNGMAVSGIGPVIYVSLPTVQFTASPNFGLTPLTVQFNTTNIDSGSNAITGWNWDFGDGSTSTLQNPSHIYSTNGIFSPTLVATNNNGSTVIGSGPSITVGTLIGNNDGFETGDFTDWTLSGDTNFTFVFNGSIPGITPYSGTYFAALGTVGSLGYLSQTLTTVPGQSYLLSLWLNSPDGLTPNEFLVSWNGSTIFDQTNLPAIGWTNLAFTVTATGTSTVLQFGFRDDPSYLGLDGVSVLPVSAAPQLAILRSAANVILTWPTNATGYTLQSATNLVPPVAWNTNPPSPVVVNGQNVVTNPISGSQMFFRLH